MPVTLCVRVLSDEGWCLGAPASRPDAPDRRRPAGQRGLSTRPPPGCVLRCACLQRCATSRPSRFRGTSSSGFAGGRRDPRLRDVRRRERTPGRDCAPAHNAGGVEQIFDRAACGLRIGGPYDEPPIENVPSVPVNRGRDNRPPHNFGPGAPGLLDPCCHALNIGRRRETSDLALRDDFIRLQFHNHPSRWIPGRLGFRGDDSARSARLPSDPGRLDR